MKICSIRIKGFQQFDDLFLDFTHPETGEPLDKICFIGANGTGKSTLLKILNEVISDNSSFGIFQGRFDSFAIKFDINGEKYIKYSTRLIGNEFYLHDSIEKEEIDWFERLNNLNQLSYYQNVLNEVGKYLLSNELENQIRSCFYNDSRTKDLIIYSPSETSNNSYLSVSDTPYSSLNDALQYFNFFPLEHVVSQNDVFEFWKLLIFQIKKRESEREIFENNPVNINKTKKQLIEEFDKISPKIIEKLEQLWNSILGKAGLSFDKDSVEIPIQLNDNLKAYIKINSTGKRINYNQLSTGIRNFIFRVGHIYSLYFNREIENGFLLIDEPENNLFPDFLYDLIEVYQQIMIDKNGNNNTQFFVSTHSPIIAAQFEPHERIILKWDENAHVYAEKGSAPIGDDPNDVLTKDFELRNLMGKAGIEAWEKFIRLNKELKREGDPDKKEKLISEISKLGNEYNFYS